ncbi:MAG TPA: Wzz/FepE/Etk N-terminal domain-containing protein [Candidatus Limnocylindrales bacterium]|nr:Wzz/FepE/Etk N-terminal domain-containing protein [Candidatus Limnocylindrales bacterium]
MAEVSEKFIVKTDVEEADETSLMDYLKVLWKWKYLIIGGTLLCMILAAIISLLMPKVYRATALLLITDPKIGGNVGVRLPPIETYVGIIKSQTVAKEILEKFSLDKPPYNLTLESLMDGMISVVPLRGTNLIRINVEYTNPEKARDIANMVAVSAVELNKALNEDETVKSRDFLKTQLDEASEALAKAEQELLAFKETSEIDKLRKEVEILLKGKERLELELLEINQIIEEQNTVVDVLGKKLGNEKKILVLSRSISNDSIMKDVVQEVSKLPPLDLLGIQAKDEQVNPLYQELEPKLVEALSGLEGLKVRKAVLARDLEANGKRLTDLQKDLAQREIKLENLTRTYELAKEVYKSLKQRFEEARIQVASKTQELKVVDSAVIPENPIKPNRKMNVLTAGAVALLGLVILAFLLEYISRYRVKPSIQTTLDSSLP